MNKGIVRAVTLISALTVVVGGLGLANRARAEIATEASVLGEVQIALTLPEFLTPEEVQTLRVVATNEQALSLFVPSQKGFAALALAPADGLIRDGKPSASAIALAELASAEEAKAKVLEACEKAKSGGDPCVVVLEVGPKP